MELTLKPKKVLNVMLAIIAILALCHVVQLIVYFQINDPDTFDFIELFDFDFESNLPSLYSSLAILLCSLLLFIIAKKSQLDQAGFSRHWYLLSLLFAFLAVDEATALHEELGDFVESLALFEASGVLYFAWVVPYSILLILFCLSYARFVFSLPQPFQWQFVACGLLFIAGAIGLEIISAKEADLNGTETIKYSVLYTIEELFEMLAIALYCNTLLRYLAGEENQFQLTLKINQA